MRLVSLLFTAAFAPGCTEGECTMSCPHEILQARVTLTAAQLSGSSLTFCVNSACHAGQLGQVDPAAVTRATLDNCTAVTLQPGSGTYDVVFGPCDVGTIVEGDMLSLAIVDGSGSSLLNRTSTVAYKDREVCGETCHILQLEF